MSKGRKVDTVRKENLTNAFKSAKNRKEFTASASTLGLSSATATVYWYNLCKENGRKVVEKRGRKTTKVDHQQRLTNIVQFATQALTEAKASKKSTVALARILELAK